MAGPTDRHIAVLGPMGVGKTTTAAALAGRLGRDHRDGDADITTATDRTGREIAAEDGVAALHRLEAAVLLEALDATGPLVVSAAASVVEDPACRRRLVTRAFVVVLALPIPDLVARIAAGEHRRPMSVEELESAQARRAPFLNELADVTLDATQSTDQLVDDVLAALPWVPPDGGTG